MGIKFAIWTRPVGLTFVVVVLFLCPDLETNKKYDVRVLAGTKQGFPTLDDARWPWVTQITEPSTTLGE